jgi:hypothetical protein
LIFGEQSLKHLPFNACDYRCEHCLATAECAVFRKLQEMFPQGSAGNDPVAVLRQVRASFQETEELIKLKARESGIDIDEIAGTSSLEDIRENERRVMNDPLYRRARDFTVKTNAFLETARTMALDEAGGYLDDIAWHHTMVTAKIYRALGWRMDEEGAIDAKNSAAVAMKSLTICIMAFDELGSRYPGYSHQCTSLSVAARRLKQAIRERLKQRRTA